MFKPYDEKCQNTIWSNLVTEKPVSVQDIGKYDYEINITNKYQKNLKTNKTKQLITEVQYESKIMKWHSQMLTYPQSTINNNSGEKSSEDCTLYTLEPASLEFREVAEYFHITVPTKHYKKKSESLIDVNRITSIKKINNPLLRKNWLHELESVKEK